MYQVYEYIGGGESVGSSRLQIETGDVFCILSHNEGKFGHTVLSNVDFGSLLPSCMFLGEHTIAEYGDMSQDVINKRHNSNSSGELIKDYGPDSFWDSVVITRG